MPRLFILLLLFVFACGEIIAQASDSEVVFGEVSRADLEMKKYEADTTATAVVLCDYGWANVRLYDDGAKLHSDYHRRIKILQPSGFDYGDVVIPFYSFKKREQFHFVKGMVHLPNGEKISLSDRDVFIEKESEYWSNARFTFPRLEVGCIIEYQYRIDSESIYELVDWFFQEEIPVRHSELKIDFPKRFAYSYLFQGNEGMKKLEDDEDGNEIFISENGKFIIGEKRFVMENAPAMKPEAFITTMDDYRARIRFQLAEMQHRDGRIEKIMTTWEHAKLDLDHHEYFGQQYRKKNRYNNIMKEVVPLAKALGEEKKTAQFLYDYILKNMKWNGYFSMATRREKLDDIFSKKEGSSGEINLILLTLLREAGIQAFPLITSTRSNGKMYEGYPLIDQFNHTLIYAVINDEIILIDATDPLRPMGFPSVEALNGRGVVIPDKGEPEWINLRPEDAREVYMFEASLDEEGNIKGGMFGAYRGYSAVNKRRNYMKNKKENNWSEETVDIISGAEINEVKTGQLENIDTTFFDTVNFKIKNAAQVANDFIYFNPVLYSNFLKNPFKQEKRNYPVDIPYPFTEQYFLNLKIPDGYIVEELPVSASFSYPGNGGLFRFVVQEKEPNLIVVNFRFIIRQLKYYPEEYQGIKELFDLVAEKCGEQIVLKKIQLTKKK